MQKNILTCRYFIECSFRGTNYHGWQIQPNALTVQSIMNDALSVLLRESVYTTGAGRTDAGVHAHQFVAHFDSAQKGIESDPGTLFRLNRILPEDIAIQRIRAVHPGAHCRFDAVSRTYIYRISREKDPFNTGLSWYLYGNIDTENMNRVSAMLKEQIDFTSFSRLHSAVKTNNCRIMHAKWEEKGNLLLFTIKADRFLRNMVRALVGTMVDVGLGKLSLEEFREITDRRDRSAASASAPARGLFLTSVEYPEDYFQTGNTT